VGDDSESAGGIRGAETGTEVVGVGDLIQDEEQRLVRGDHEVIEVVLGKMGDGTCGLAMAIGAWLVGWLGYALFSSIVRLFAES